MNRSLLLIAVVASAIVAASAATNLVEEFEAFKVHYDKKYDTPAEEAKRFGIFVQNMKKAAELQKRNPHATFGANEFADMSAEEFKSRHNYKPSGKKRENLVNRTHEQIVGAPKSWDWRQHGGVTPVKNQGQCGSCWAFSTVQNIEGSWALAGNPLTKLSPQEVTSCCYGAVCGGSMGCNGGDPGPAFDWLVLSQGGWITSEADYPYFSGGGSTGMCELPKPHVAQIYSHHNVMSDESVMSSYLQANAPLSICLAAGSWQMYSGGVMTDCFSDSVDHCVLAVGYDLNAFPPYWIVKNSWGASWGEWGYIRLEYGTNQCDLTSEPRNSLVHRSGPPPTPVPIVPPPPTPSPIIRYFTQYTCESSACDKSKCKSDKMEQGHCIVSPQGFGIIATCGGSNLNLKMSYNKDCSGNSWTQTEPLNRCLASVNNTYVEFVCPTN